MKVNILLVSKSLKLIRELRARQVDITFVWVPSHVGIGGNEAADREAKKSLTKGGHSDLHPLHRPKALYSVCLLARVAGQVGDREL